MRNQGSRTVAATDYAAAGKAGRRGFLRRAGNLALAAAAVDAFGSGSRPAAAAEPGQALVDGAKKEGTLTLYTGSEQSIVVNLAQAFQNKYGISLQYQRLNSAEVGARYTAEAAAGRTVADVILTGDLQLMETFINKGWLGRLDPGSVPGLAEWPAAYKDDHSAIVTINPYTIAINTQMVKEEPQDWQYLIKPELSGNIVTLDLKRVNLVAYAAWDMLLRRYGDDFIRRIGQQKLRLADSGPSAVQQLASSAASAYFACSMTEAASMIAQGAPIKAVLPKNQPYTGVTSPATISQKAPHPNAARLFVAFLLSPDGQKILNTVASSPNNTPGTPSLPPGFVKPDFHAAAADRTKLIQLLGM